MEGRLRWIGLPFAAAVALWPRPAPPVIWVAVDGADAAIIVQGREVALRPGVRGYATDLWAQRRGLAVPADMESARGALFDCDYWSCVARPGVAPQLGVWWTRRKPHAERLAELCARSDVLVLRADLTPPAACRDALVLTAADFDRGGAAEIYGRLGLAGGVVAAAARRAALDGAGADTALSSPHAVQAAEFVAVHWTAQVGEIELAEPPSRTPGGSSQVVPPLATPAACQASACAGRRAGEADVVAIGVGGASSLIGLVTAKMPVGVM